MSLGLIWDRIKNMVGWIVGLAITAGLIYLLRVIPIYFHDMYMKGLLGASITSLFISLIIQVKTERETYRSYYANKSKKKEKMGFWEQGFYHLSIILVLVGWISWLCINFPLVKNLCQTVT